MPVICNVARNASKKPILFLPGNAKNGYGTGLPKGDVAMLCNGKVYSASVAKIAINVVRDVATGKNALPAILTGWFGESAGAPGNKGRVVVRPNPNGAGFIMEPVTPAAEQAA